MPFDTGTPLATKLGLFPQHVGARPLGFCPRDRMEKSVPPFHAFWGYIFDEFGKDVPNRITGLSTLKFQMTQERALIEMRERAFMAAGTRHTHLRETASAVVNGGDRAISPFCRYTKYHVNEVNSHPFEWTEQSLACLEATELFYAAVFKPQSP